jgi:hypothetical protein
MNQSPAALKRAMSQNGPQTDDRSVPRRKLDEILETVPNDLDDATHRRMDAAALEEFDDFAAESFSTPFANVLLATIVSTSEGRLNERYFRCPDVGKLLQQHPDLMVKLEKAWNDKSFANIRNLSAALAFCQMLDDL